MNLTAEEMRVVVESQPRLYIEAMLEDYDRARMADAREAILTRLGAVLLSTYAVTPTLREITTEPWKSEKWVARDEPETLRDLIRDWIHVRKQRRAAS